ncbi:hypothetical protein MA16_Dca003253 [Dendrobium catenatum]|uniref:Uncharacterized protein n=1 Tax=Dendrobium catenatum TaxID=906689 RepID=A0A2I0XC92_9ASPA|nr:hypothetical protein MA16_Dca003253 [Dendrobium catenatum]
MEEPEWNFGFEYDRNGRIDILRSPFFDVGFDFDDTPEEYLDRILPTLVDSIDDHFSVYTWIIEGRPSAPSNPTSNPATSPLKVRKELDLCKDQCNGFREKLRVSEEDIKREKDSSMLRLSEIGKLKEELNRFKTDTDGNENAICYLGLVSSQFHSRSAEVHSLRSTLLRVTGERDSLLSKVEQLRGLGDKMEIFEGKYDDLQSNAEFCLQEMNHRISRFEVEIKEVVV